MIKKSALSLILCALSFNVVASGLTTLKNANSIKYDQNNFKILSEGYVYVVDNKIANLPAKKVCNQNISISSKSILEKKKATKKQKGLRCYKKTKSKKKTR